MANEGNLWNGTPVNIYRTLGESAEKLNADKEMLSNTRRNRDAIRTLEAEISQNDVEQFVLANNNFITTGAVTRDGDVVQIIGVTQSGQPVYNGIYDAGLTELVKVAKLDNTTKRNSGGFTDKFGNELNGPYTDQEVEILAKTGTLNRGIEQITADYIARRDGQENASDVAKSLLAKADAINNQLPNDTALASTHTSTGATVAERDFSTPLTRDQHIAELKADPNHKARVEANLAKIQAQYNDNTAAIASQPALSTNEKVAAPEKLSQNADREKAIAAIMKENNIASLNGKYTEAQAEKVYEFRQLQQTNPEAAAAQAATNLASIQALANSAVNFEGLAQTRANGPQLADQNSITNGGFAQRLPTQSKENMI